MKFLIKKKDNNKIIQSSTLLNKLLKEKYFKKILSYETFSIFVMADINGKKDAKLANSKITITNDKNKNKKINFLPTVRVTK
jgi:hypothetical protein